MPTYSPDFQRAVLALMYQDVSFLTSSAAYLTPDFFDRKVDSVFAEIFINYAKKFPGQPMSKFVVLNEIQRLTSAKRIEKTEAPDFVNAFGAIVMPVASEKYVRSCMKDFFRHKAIESQLVKATVRLKKGEYDEIVNDIVRVNASIVGSGDAEDFFPIDDVDARVIRYSSPLGLSIAPGYSTSVQALDSVMLRKGVGPKEMLVVCGSPGRGKSIFLLNMAVIAMLAGVNVLFYTLEVDRDIVMMRMDACLTGVPFADLHLKTGLVKARWDAIKKMALGEFILRDLPPRFLTPNKIRSDLHRIFDGRKARGLDPKGKGWLVVIDYADIQASDKRIDERRLEHGDVYEQDRAIAKEFEVGVATASQANRPSLRKQEVDLDAFSEDFSKAFTADYVVGLSQTKVEEAERKPNGSGTGAQRLFVAKNRNGVKGVAVKVMTDFTRMRYSMDDWTRFDAVAYAGISPAAIPTAA